MLKNRHKKNDLAELAVFEECDVCFNYLRRRRVSARAPSPSRAEDDGSGMMVKVIESADPSPMSNV